MKKVMKGLILIVLLVLAIPAAAQAGRIPGKTCKGLHYKGAVVQFLGLRGNVSCRTATTLAKRYYDVANPTDPQQKARSGFMIPGFPAWRGYWSGGTPFPLIRSKRDVHNVVAVHGPFFLSRVRAARLPPTDDAGCLKHLPSQHLRHDQCALLLPASHDFYVDHGHLHHWTGYTLAGHRLYPQWYSGCGCADLYTVRRPNNTYRSYARYGKPLGFPMFEVKRAMALVISRSLAVANTPQR